MSLTTSSLSRINNADKKNVNQKKHNIMQPQGNISFSKQKKFPRNNADHTERQTEGN